MDPSSEPEPDVPNPQPANEEIVDPTVPAGSSTVVTIKRHPFGLVALYLEVLVGLIGGLGLLYFLLSSVVSSSSKTQATNWFLVFAVVVISFAVVILLIMTAIYRQNRWVVTDDSITQVSQKGLFSRQMSELSMANIEDITAEQRGILATLFGFGTIKAETAGELPYFHFNYCPNPNTYAKVILDARERFINENPAVAKRANELLDVPREPRS